LQLCLGARLRGGQFLDALFGARLRGGEFFHALFGAHLGRGQAFQARLDPVHPAGQASIVLAGDTDRLHPIIYHGYHSAVHLGGQT